MFTFTCPVYIFCECEFFSFFPLSWLKDEIDSEKKIKFIFADVIPKCAASTLQIVFSGDFVGILSLRSMVLLF